MCVLAHIGICIPTHFLRVNVVNLDWNLDSSAELTFYMGGLESVLDDPDSNACANRAREDFWRFFKQKVIQVYPLAMFRHPPHNAPGYKRPCVVYFLHGNTTVTAAILRGKCIVAMRIFLSRWSPLP